VFKARNVWAPLIAVGLVGCGGSGGSGGSGTLPTPPANEFRIGALVSLTGNWNTLGKTSKAAVELAAADVNTYFQSQGIALRVKPVIADTKLNPATALTQMTKLQGESVNVFIGPQSSAEVAALKPSADSTGAVLISQGSTASSLSIANDNVFRMCPDDVREAEALVALLQADGVQAIVPVARKDAGNQGLFNSVTARFGLAGGTTSTGVIYDTTLTDFTATLASISSQVTALQALKPGAKIAVYLAAFDEAASILAAAGNDPVLSTVKWYGSDGVALSAALTANAACSAFAIKSGFPNPNFGLDDARVGTWAPIAARIKAKSGIDPDAFALSAYDGVWVAALARAKETGAWNAATFGADFMSTASTYVGITGPTKLDAEGDRDAGNFDFWGIVSSGSGFTWKRVAVYEASTGVIER